MTLHYTFENITLTDYVGGYPKKKHYEEYNYDFETDITEEDIVNYLFPTCMKNTNDEKIYKSGLQKAIRFFVDQNSIDFDCLENDEYLMEYLKERYKDKALDKLFEDENE